MGSTGATSTTTKASSRIAWSWEAASTLEDHFLWLALAWINRIGWDPENVPAYDTFRYTLLMGAEGMMEVLKCLDIMKDKGCHPGHKFLSFSLESCRKHNDLKAAAIAK
ncbi:unnamed protein product [Linum trigynum]|uniref:Pentatricopeptide repeat-containing protein n=1 Tax=Linum trigynum TaxID=586398 RepID=A0AAV2DD48_9ROSI